MKVRLTLAVAVGCLSLVPMVAQAQNTTVGTAAFATANGPSIYQSYTNAADQRWYLYEVVPGRSYCVETTNAFFENTGVDTIINVFRSDGTTAIAGAANDDASSEPRAFRGSRACYIALAADGTIHAVRVIPFSAPATTQFFQIRVVDNTMFSPWFFSGSGYEAFILMKNTTDTAMTATVTLRSTAGAVLGTATAAVPANGSLNYQVSAAPFSLASAVGGVEVAYNGAAGALAGSVTSLNFAAGVSFDAPFTPRLGWAGW